MTTNKKAADCANSPTAHTQKTRRNSNIANSRAAQRERIGRHLLKHGRATTIDLRDDCGVMHPAGRIMEMRAIGWPIVTTWIWATDHEGRPHRCGLYILSRSGVCR